MNSKRKKIAVGFDEFYVVLETMKEKEINENRKKRK